MWFIIGLNKNPKTEILKMKKFICIISILLLLILNVQLVSAAFTILPVHIEIFSAARGQEYENDSLPAVLQQHLQTVEDQGRYVVGHANVYSRMDLSLPINKVLDDLGDI